jgi:hypothetical protein
VRLAGEGGRPGLTVGGQGRPASTGDEDEAEEATLGLAPLAHCRRAARL